jgi:hypothetical protein
LKGIVFNLLEQCVREEHGEDTWDDLLDAAGVEGAYTSLGNYEDDEFRALVAAAAHALELSCEEVERWFGRAAMAPLAERYPELFEPHQSTSRFVLTLNDIIHPEVRKLYPGADVPDFDLQTESAHRVTLKYRSPRRMCAFAEGLIEGAAQHYGEQVRIEQPSCMLHGAEACTIVCHFAPADTDG